MSTQTKPTKETSVLCNEYSTSQQLGQRKRLTTKKIRLVSLQGNIYDRTIDLTITAKLPVVEVSRGE